MTEADSTLRTLTGYQLRRAAAPVQLLINQVLGRFGLRRTTFSALTLIVDNPGMSQAQLAEALAIERPNLVQIVGELEASGLIERRTADGDRRAYALQPTMKGRKLQHDALEAARKTDAAITEGLSEEVLVIVRDALLTIERNATEAQVSDERQISRA